MAVGNSFGAGISAKDNAAMLLAALVGHDGMIRFLLQHGAKLDDWAELALLMAEQNGHSETASLLAAEMGLVRIQTRHRPG